METPRIPVIPIPPSSEIKVPPRPLLADIIEESVESDPADPLLAQAEQTVDRVDFSPEGRSYISARRLVQEILAQLSSSFEEAVGSQRVAGQESFAARFEAHSDFSPEGTADLILSGVTGYIYSAFRRSRPEMTAADLETFREQAARGIEKGSAEASAYLEGLDLFERDAEQSTSSIRDRVLVGLDRFISNEQERLFGAESAE